MDMLRTLTFFMALVIPAMAYCGGSDRIDSFIAITSESGSDSDVGGVEVLMEGPVSNLSSFNQGYLGVGVKDVQVVDYIEEARVIDVYGGLLDGKYSSPYGGIGFLIDEDTVFDDQNSIDLGAYVELGFRLKVSKAVQIKAFLKRYDMETDQEQQRYINTAGVVFAYRL